MSNFIPIGDYSVDNPYYKNVYYGGHNYCISRNKNTGWVLPNCTGWAYARFMECQGVNTCGLSTANASYWYSWSDSSIQRGSVAKVGAVACWGGGYYEGAGHVAFVEDIQGDTIILSESNYSGPVFQYRYCDSSMRIEGTGDIFYFQGFLYNPTEFNGGIVPVDPPKPPNPQLKVFRWWFARKKVLERKFKL